MAGLYNVIMHIAIIENSHVRLSIWLKCSIVAVIIVSATVWNNVSFVAQDPTLFVGAETKRVIS